MTNRCVTGGRVVGLGFGLLAMVLLGATGEDRANPACARTTLSPIAANFSFRCGSLYDPPVAVKHVGPSIAKTRQAPLVQQRTRPLVRCADYRWRELFEQADVLSEGAVRKEDEGPTYYGSTSILLTNRTHGGDYADSEGPTICHLLEHDPHARIRAIRIACLEAELRANAQIGSLRAELVVLADPRGVRITVDVEARVIEQFESRSASARLHRRARH